MRRIFEHSFFPAITLGLLIGVAVVLGIKIVQRSATPKTAASPSGQMPVRVADSAPDRLLTRDLTREEQAALNTPPKGASEEELQRHFEIVRPLAKRAEFLNITGCLGDPIVFEVTQEMMFIVKNNDAASHTIQLDPGHLYTIPAGGEKEITADFGFGPGVYGYGCDNSLGASGIFLVTPKQ